MPNPKQVYEHNLRMMGYSDTKLGKYSPDRPISKEPFYNEGHRQALASFGSKDSILLNSEKDNFK